jgi:hypothetical protein
MNWERAVVVALCAVAGSGLGDLGATMKGRSVKASNSSARVRRRWRWSGAVLGFVLAEAWYALG